jgi:hypothetical protein
MDLKHGEVAERPKTGILTTRRAALDPVLWEQHQGTHKIFPVRNTIGL